VRGPASAVLAGLGTLWALPATLASLLLAALCLGRSRWRRGVLWFEADRGAGALIGRGRGGPAATTFGNVVLLWRPQRLNDGREAHELVRVLGFFFFPLYLALLPIFGWRDRHPLERPAYHREREVECDG